MKLLETFVAVFQHGIAPVFLLAAVSLAQASTIWNGPNIGFFHTSANHLKDQLTPGVAITRNTNKLVNVGGLYNAVTETSPFSGTSPKDTTWVIGTLSDYTNGLISSDSFDVCPLESGNTPPNYIGTTFVVHLTNEDVYLELTLTNWGGSGGAGDKTFGYTRSTPAPVSPPTISITNPVGGTVFAAPANVTIQANVTNGSGGVTNVQFRVGSKIFANKSTPPFSATTNNLAAGNYTLTAIASDSGGLTAANSVAISVVTPVPILLGSAMPTSATSFQFSYAASVGLSYVVQNSADLGPGSWVSIVTNVAASNPVVFVDVNATNNPAFYRVGQMPNP